MKQKILIVALFFCCLTELAFAQEKKDTIRLKYDEEGNEIVKPKIKDSELKKGENYIFEVNSNQPSKLDSVIFKSTFYKRSFTTPDVLKSIVNFSSLIVRENKKRGTQTKEFSSQKIKIRGEYTTLNLNLILTNQGETDTTLVSQNIEFYNNSYWRLGVSTGLFFSDLANPSYYFADSSSSPIDIEKEDRSPFDISIGGLLQVQYAFRSYLKVGPAVGISASILDLKPKYLLGGAVTIFRKHEITVSGGIAGSNLAEVSNRVNSPGYKFDVSSTPPTYNKLKWGYFFGLSYSILK